MIPFDPLRPPAPGLGPIRVHRVKPVSARANALDDEAKERRKKSDRRKSRYRHRGPFEMRSGIDRRDSGHIDEEV
ncbi:MAG TPA: hypothetical protein VIC26_09880 [Marinagarivorans sp.]